MKENERSGARGIPANAIILPLEITLGLLLILIIILVYEVNRSSNELSDLMERSGVYQQEVTNLLAGSNTLSETASSFVQIPVNGDGATNAGPLMAYAQELGNDRRGPQIAERFRDYDVGDEVQGYVDHAAETSEAMLDIQTRVLSLIRTVYPFPPIPELSALPELPLSEEELAMPEEERLGYARSLILSSDYSLLKHAISEDVANCNRILQQAFSSASAQTRRHVTALRSALWAVIGGIVIILLLAFGLLRFRVVRPLRRHAAEISRDDSMQQTSHIREMRVLVNAYNALLNRRNKLEAILRSAAETDALTGLPNRYSMERYALEAAGDDSAMAVLVFDVNYLKQTNDTEGHLAGDELLRTAGACIRECFAIEGCDNCYRLGGDEFAAVLRGRDERDVKASLARFALAQEREGISISVGYAYARKTDEDSFRKLLDEADRQMYEKKKQAHEAHQNGLGD